MANFFEVKVKFDGIDQETGKEKKMRGVYLVEAITMGDAETRTIEKLAPLVKGQFDAINIKALSSEIDILTNSKIYGAWFKIKTAFWEENEFRKKKKRTTNTLVYAPTADDALFRYNEGFAGMTFDYSVETVTKTKIEDVFWLK